MAPNRPRKAVRVMNGYVACVAVVSGRLKWASDPFRSNTKTSTADPPFAGRLFSQPLLLLPREIPHQLQPGIDPVTHPRHLGSVVVHPVDEAGHVELHAVQRRGAVAAPPLFRTGFKAERVLKIADAEERVVVLDVKQEQRLLDAAAPGLPVERPFPQRFEEQVE